MRTPIRAAIILAALLIGFTPQLSRAQPDIQGSLESDAYVFVQDSIRMAREINEFRLRFDTAGDRLGLTASTNVYTNQSRVDIDLWEGYVDYFGSFYDLRIGKQIVTWGTGDGINPTDNFNPLNLRRKSPFSEMEDRKIPVNMFQANAYLGPLRLTGIWVPDFHPFVLPDTSVWQMEMPSVRPEASTGMVIDGFNTPSSPSHPSNTLANSEFGVKASSRLLGVDLSLSYYHGWDDFPTLHPEYRLNGIDASGRPHITVEPDLRFHQLDMVGGDFAASLFGIGLRGEGGYFLTEDTEESDPVIQDPYWHYLVGLDYTFKNGLYVNSQYVYGLFNRYGLRTGPADNRLITAGLTYDLNDYTSLELGAMYAIDDENYLIKPRISRSVGSALNVSLGAYIIDGNTDSHFGAFRRNDQVYAEIRYQF